MSYCILPLRVPLHPKLLDCYRPKKSEGEVETDEPMCERLGPRGAVDTSDLAREDTNSPKAQATIPGGLGVSNESAKVKNDDSCSMEVQLIQTTPKSMVEDRIVIESRAGHFSVCLYGLLQDRFA